MTVFNKNQIEIGDCAILRFGHDELVPIIVKENSIDQTKFGAVRHNDLINKKYGSKVQILKSFNIYKLLYRFLQVKGLYMFYP